jgi:uncharacterized phage protein (TIGR01671 family)
MRAIKFRGKDTKSGEWRYGDLITYKSGEAAIANFSRYGYECSDMNRVLVGLKTVGQFTGLHDKNGKEIFEGDILLWTRKNVHIEGRQPQDFSHKCVVYYDNDKCAFQFRCELRCGACVGYLDFDDDRTDESFVEVVGNIHDNPDLIEKGGEE